MREIKKEFKKRLMESLEKDIKLWKRESHAAADQAWDTYYSPQYKNISFQVKNLAFGTCVFFEHGFRFSFFVIPFGKLWKLQRKMKKAVDKKILEEETVLLQSALER